MWLSYSKIIKGSWITGIKVNIDILTEGVHKKLGLNTGTEITLNLFKIKKKDGLIFLLKWVEEIYSNYCFLWKWIYIFNGGIQRKI